MEDLKLLRSIHSPAVLPGTPLLFPQFRYNYPDPADFLHHLFLPQDSGSQLVLLLQ